MKWYYDAGKDNWLKRLRRVFCSHNWKESGRSDTQGELWTNYDYLCKNCGTLKWY